MEDPLADMVVEVREHIAAPRPQVFALLTDVERMAGLGPEHVEARWDDGGGPALGATFTGVNERDGRRWEVPCRVVALDPPAVFGWQVGDPEQPTATWTYTLSEHDDGTQVVQRFAHGPGWSFLRKACERYPERTAELVAGRSQELARNMRAVLQAAAAELRAG